MYIYGMLVMWPSLRLTVLLHSVFYNKNRKQVKNRFKCFMFVCWKCSNCLVGLNYRGSKGRGLGPINRFKPPPVIYY